MYFCIFHWAFIFLSFFAFHVSLQKLQQELEFLEVQEEYIKDEQKNLKKEFLHAQEEVKRIQSIPLVIGQFLEAVDQNTAIVGSTTGINKCLSDNPVEYSKPCNKYSFIRNIGCFWWNLSGGHLESNNTRQRPYNKVNNKINAYLYTLYIYR